MDTEMLMSLKVVARISSWVNVFNPGGLILIESLEIFHFHFDNDSVGHWDQWTN